jgi:hypothetical protein
MMRNLLADIRQAGGATRATKKTIGYLDEAEVAPKELKPC